MTGTVRERELEALSRSTLSDVRAQVRAWRARRVRLPAGAVPEPVIADS